MSNNIFNKILVKKYAKGFSSYQGIENLKLLKKDLIELNQVFLSNVTKNQLNFLNVISAKAQSIIIKKILEKYSFDTNLINFCILLTDNKRLYLLPDIINQLLTDIDDSNNILNVEVTSVEELNESDLINIKTELNYIYKKNIQIRSKIDKTILGGLIINVGSKMFDDSLISKFKKLKNSLS